MEYIDLLWYILGIILSIIGIIGCFIPVLPGPPFNYAALLLIYFTTKTEFTTDFLIFWFLATVVVTVLDYIVPVIGSKKMGGSNYGVWGSGLGLLAGLIFFPPFGLIIGPIAGAWIGELIAGKTGTESFKAAMGSFLGFLAGTILKLIAASTMTYFYLVEIF